MVIFNLKKSFSKSHSRQLRFLSTFRSASGRYLTVTKSTPTITQTCRCEIKFPGGLEIDRSRPIINTVSSYNQHILIATGKSDWTSKIKNEEGIGDMAKTLKDMAKVKGEWHDPNYSTMISASSFKCDPLPQPDNQPSPGPSQFFTSLKLFPHFLHFPHIQNTPTHRSYFASTYLGDQSIRPLLTPSTPPNFVHPQPITKPTILICSHGSRDMRCGVLGPLLYDKFLEYIEPESCDVGMISHVGGHAFAGNVIVYLPPGHTIAADAGDQKTGKPGNIETLTKNRLISPLAHMGIWYGRVGPEHVRSIVEETVLKGNIIGELWRGGLDMDTTGGKEGWKDRTPEGRILRIPSELLKVEGGEGSVIEENDDKDQVLDTEMRVEMMGQKARERWEGVR
ncbi:MAG: hypothetical protein Q9209_003827 [Squamulea sp. 1 TL-2023]